MKINKNDFRFGFEIEIIDKTTSSLLDCRKDYHSNIWQFGDNFRIEEDGSLSYGGVEIVSRIYTINQFDKIKKVFFDEILPLSSGLRIDDTCGLHISFSLKKIPLQKIFLFSLLKRLRNKVLEMDKENNEIFKKDYFRNYSKKMYDYNDYWKSRYLEFNLRDKYIEWRSIHVRHLYQYQGRELAVKIFDFIKKVNLLIIDEVKKFVKEPKDKKTLDFKFIYLEDEKKTFYFDKKIINKKIEISLPIINL